MIAMNIHRMLKYQLHLPAFAVLNPCLSVSSFHPLFVICFFCFFSTTCEMPTQPSVRRNNWVRNQMNSQTNKTPAFMGTVSQY